MGTRLRNTVCRLTAGALYPLVIFRNSPLLTFKRDGFVLFSYTVQIEVVFLVFGQEKNVLVFFREAVFDALRHAVRLCPNDIISDQPPALLTANSEAVRKQKQ